MVEGKFVNSNKPMVPISVGWGDFVQTTHFILDTGFTGDLVVPPDMAKELGLINDAVEPIRIGGNTIIHKPTASAYAILEEETLLVTAIICEGLPFVGISLMEKFKYQAVVDCKNKKVRLEAAP